MPGGHSGASDYRGSCKRSTLGSSCVRATDVARGEAGSDWRTITRGAGLVRATRRWAPAVAVLTTEPVAIGGAERTPCRRSAGDAVFVMRFCGATLACTPGAGLADLALTASCLRRVASASAASRALTAASSSERAVATSARVFTSSSNRLARTRLSRAISSSGDATTQVVQAMPNPRAATNAKLAECRDPLNCGCDIGGPPVGAYQHGIMSERQSCSLGQ